MTVDTTAEIEVTGGRASQMAWLFGTALFLSAFLLFCCEPMVGKMMLPLLGGAASVWITCLLFFQLMLLAGYIYAHLLEMFFDVRKQVLVHFLFMVVAFLFLPIRLSHISDGVGVTYPTAWLLGVLFKTVGFPFGILATTAPLLQNWLSKTRTEAGRDPYFLYAISNAGSLMALIAYPLLIEPNLGVHMQTLLWLGGYGLLLLMVFAPARIVAKASDHAPVRGHRSLQQSDVDRPSWRVRGYWTAAAFVPSALMLAVSNHILQNVVAAPFLWILPLAAYLVTFMVAFGRRVRVSWELTSQIIPIVLLVLFPIVTSASAVPGRFNWLLIAEHIVLLVAASLLCHTALASRRPDPQYLTEFYFWIALGGALGGTFTAVVAPLLFSRVLEYPLLVAFIPLFRATPGRNFRFRWTDGIYAAAVLGCLAVVWVLGHWAGIDIMRSTGTSAAANLVFVIVPLLARNRRIGFALAFVVLFAGHPKGLPAFLKGNAQSLHIARNFFGIKKVVYRPETNMRELSHGDTLHGLESLDPALAGEPLSYFHRTGPVGDVMQAISARLDQHIGVVGLGTGSIAAYAGQHRRITFLDIDPQVYSIAKDYFTFMSRCGSNCDVLIGDGRILVGTMPAHQFDLLILDAFNSDSIPAHLVSREAIQIYLSKLKPDGLILFHVSNRYLDVERLVAAVSTDAGLETFRRFDSDEKATGKLTSKYVVAARRFEDLLMLPHSEQWTRVTKPHGFEPWTDDYSNMLALLF